MAKSETAETTKCPDGANDRAPTLHVARWLPSLREADAWLEALARALIAAHRRQSAVTRDPAAGRAASRCSLSPPEA